MINFGPVKKYYISRYQKLGTEYYEKKNRNASESRGQRSEKYRFEVELDVGALLRLHPHLHDAFAHGYCVFVLCDVADIEEHG